MKNVIMTTALMMTLTATSAMAAHDFTSGMESRLAGVCTAIKSGSQIQLAKAVKASNLSYEKVANDLRCNGMSGIEFARYSKQTATADYLVSRSTPKGSRLLAKRDQ